MLIEYIYFSVLRCYNNKYKIFAEVYLTMDNQTLHDRFRSQLTNVHALTVLTISLFEIIGYTILVLCGIEFFSLQNHYLWYGVVFPIIANAVTHLIARLIINNFSIPRRKKNKTIIVAALVTSFIVAIIHREYIITSCAFVFPIILSSMFNDKKLLNISFISSIFIFILVGLAFYLDKSITVSTSINLFILFGFSLISYLCGIISINFSKQNYTTIESQAAQNNKLLQDVLFDQMTGLYNHNSFIVQLEEHIKNHDSMVPFCLAIIDVDDFKNINDTYGHSYGDTVLIYLAEILKKHCIPNDTAYRYGGEEFAILFFGKDKIEAQDISKRILSEFRKHKFEFTDKSVSFSVGIAEYSGEITRTEFFEKADELLYQAKKEGKNRVLTE